MNSFIPKRNVQTCCFAYKSTSKSSQKINRKLWWKCFWNPYRCFFFPQNMLVVWTSLKFVSIPNFSPKPNFTSNFAQTFWSTRDRLSWRLNTHPKLSLYTGIQENLFPYICKNNVYVIILILNFFEKLGRITIYLWAICISSIMFIASAH